MLDEKMLSFFKDDTQVVDATVVVNVKVQPSIVMEELANVLVDEIHRVSGYSHDPVIEGLDKKDILKYLSTLTWMRVQHVLRAENSSFSSYRRLYMEAAVPALAYQIFVCVGEAFDRDFGLKFLPVAEIQADDLLAPDQMKLISDVLSRLERNGLNIVYGLPRDRSGEIGFMAMTHVDGVVRSYRKDHPVYGFLASFFRQEVLNEVTGTMSRVVYGYVSDYRYRVSRLI